MGSRTVAVRLWGDAVVRRRGLYLLVFAVGLAGALGLGAYRNTMADAESVHYSLNFPARGYAAGGEGAMGKSGHVIVNVGNTGIIKRLLQPNEVNLSSHWVKNVGDTPRRIRLEAEGVQYPLKWASMERSWDDRTLTLGRRLKPGESVTVDWELTLPRPLPNGIIVDSRIVVYDADTGERLTAMPIRIVNGAAAAAKAGDCCAE
jgi:hypothetical protein